MHLLFGALKIIPTQRQKNYHFQTVNNEAITLKALIGVHWLLWTIRQKPTSKKNWGTLKLEYIYSSIQYALTDSKNRVMYFIDRRGVVVYSLPIQDLIGFDRQI